MSALRASPLVEIRITRNERGEVEVWEGDRTTGALCAGEMLEQAIALIYPEGILKHTQHGKARRTCYAMRTPEEWAQEYPGKAKPKLSRWQKARVWIHVLGGPVGVGSLLAFVAILIAIGAGMAR